MLSHDQRLEAEGIAALHIMRLFRAIWCLVQLITDHSLAIPPSSLSVVAEHLLELCGSLGCSTSEYKGEF